MKRLFYLVFMGALIMGCVSTQIKQAKIFDPLEIADTTSDAITVKDGEYFKFTLIGNYTTGYSWSIMDDYDKSMVALKDQKYVVDNNNGVGVPGKDTFTFVSLKKGTTVISLIYKRPWEDRTDDKKVKYTVVVE